MHLTIRAAAVALLGLSGVAAAAGPALAPLEQVAEFEHEATGVTVSSTGRIFVNFPRWTEDAPVSVAEVMKDGSIKPYPDAGWNAWRNTRQNKLSPKDHWVCVQSVVADAQGNLWVLDPAAPATESIVKGGPKLVKINLATNKVAQTIAFDEQAAPQGAYLNDVRFSPDGKTAYLTDSGAKGSLLVVDLQSGAARRVLDGDPSTQPDKSVVVQTDGKPLRRPDGRGAQFAADGIALSPAGDYLYWQALTGKTTYRIATAVLRNAALSAKDVAAKVEKFADGEPSDGYWIDPKGRLFISAMQENAVKMFDGKAFVTVAQDARLRWPDTFSQGPDGAIYVTASHIMDNAWYQPASGPAIKTQLFRFQPPQ